MSPLGEHRRRPTPDSTSIERDASDWLALDDRGMTAEEERKFERWLAADPRHGEFFAEMGGTWALLGRVRERREAFSTRSADRTPSRGLFRAGLVAAAFLAAASALWWFTILRSHGSAGNGATEVVGPRTIDLPDGSVVRVNAGSAIEVKFTAANRNVRLVRGEARFAVAKDARRAFLGGCGRHPGAGCRDRLRRPAFGGQGRCTRDRRKGAGNRRPHRNARSRREWKATGCACRKPGPTPDRLCRREGFCFAFINGPGQSQPETAVRDRPQPRPRVAATAPGIPRLAPLGNGGQLQPLQSPSTCNCRSRPCRRTIWRQFGARRRGRFRSAVEDPLRGRH